MFLIKMPGASCKVCAVPCVFKLSLDLKPQKTILLVLWTGWAMAYHASHKSTALQFQRGST